MTLTDTLAEYAVGFSYKSAPVSVADAGKALVLDGLGCLIAGASHPVGDILREYATEVGGNPTSTLVGSPRRTSAPLASFVNGALLHVNDFEPQGATPMHGTSNLLPPALALAEQNNTTGEEFLSAIVAGWEIQTRLRTAGPRHLGGFHPPGIYGPLGAATVAGKLLHLSVDQMRMAYGIAASRTGGLFANNGTMVKSTHPGNAGRMGVESAMLARLGFTSEPDILGAPRGFVETVLRGSLDESKLLAGLGSQFYIENPGFSIKPYPAEVNMQVVIEAVAGLPERISIEPGQVTVLTLHLFEIREDLSRPNPASGLDGKFSYEYCAAAALVEPRVRISSFSDETRFSWPIVEALAKTRLVADPDLPDTPAGRAVTAVLELTDGRTISNTCEMFRGFRLNPLTRDERLAKFFDCTVGPLDRATADDLVDAVEHIEREGSLATISAGLQQLAVAERP